MSEKLRKEFLVILGDTYDEYGYPNFCGWVEGLLLLEAHEWTQKEISSRLRQLLPDSKYPTSLSSINRALKILEDYGVIERSGSRKIGYKYRLGSSSSLLVSMLQWSITVNQNLIRKLETLMAKNIEADRELKNAVLYQVNGAKSWNQLFEGLLQSISKTGEMEKQKLGVRKTL